MNVTPTTVAAERARLAATDPGGEAEAVAPLPYEAMVRDPKTGEWHLPLPAPPSPIVGIDAYRAAVPVDIPWIARPLAYSGGVTLISGPPKAGKSTLAAQLQRSRETGEPLFGAWPVTIGPTLLVTEEGGHAVVYKTDGMHALDVLDRKAAAGLQGFGDVLDIVAAWSAAHPGGLVFIDTLSIWAGIADENDSTATTAAIGAVTGVAQITGLAIVLIHHSRKGGGDNGEAIRGSGAILATVDIAAEMSRVTTDGDDRYLDVQGRVILPERYRLTFDRDTFAYALTDQGAARLAEIEGYLVGIPADGPGLSSTDLTNVWGVNPRRRSEHLLDVGRMRREMVKTGRVYGWRYWSITAVMA